MVVPTTGVINLGTPSGGQADVQVHVHIRD